MDETSVWNDMAFNTTIDKQGAQSVCLKRTGHEKYMASLCLADKTDGTKVKPFVVFCAIKRESNSLDEEFKPRCVVTSSGNAWMNEEVTTIWMKGVLGVFLFNRRLLVWDSYERHMNDSVTKNFKEINVDSRIIPGACTKYIQAPDACWKKPFKGRMIELYDQWLSEGVHQFTEG